MKQTKDESFKGYSELLREHGDNPKTLEYGSRDSQNIRFKVLSEIEDLEGTSVLDVGCGLGHLSDYFWQNGILLDYTGLDMNPDLLEVARTRTIGAKLIEANFLTWEPDKCYDFVFASGLLYRMTDLGLIWGSVEKMFNIAERGAAFNTLSSKNPKYGVPFSVKIDGKWMIEPSMALSHCMNICPRTMLRHDYLPHDFTVYMLKEP